MRWTALLLVLTGCTTDEVRGWELHRDELQRRDAELSVLASSPGLEARRARIAELRTALDLSGFVRRSNLPARVFVEPGRQRVVISAPVDVCRTTLSGLSAARWLLPTWRLRLEDGRCEFEAQTGEVFNALEVALVVPAPTWTPPPRQLLSRSLTSVQHDVGTLERSIAEQERALGDGAVLAQLEQRLALIAPKLTAAQAERQACIAWVLERELALDEKDRGKGLELTNERLIHPLEPKNDFRLRGLVDVVDGRLTWRCEER